VLVDLVQTTTRDGVRLDGSLQVPNVGAASIPADAFCLVHGTGGNFYSSTLFDAFAERLLGMGCAVLRVNTRGHDGISNAVTARGGQRLGAAYEIVDDCRHDLAAWLDWLRQRAGSRVGLIGHSLGAVKCLYAQAHEPALNPACIVAVSPPRLSYSWFCSGAAAGEFLRTYQQAQEHLDGGRPTGLLDVKFPMSFAITAAGYAEKYGPDERYNYLNLVSGVKCPTLITLGSLEVENNAAFQGTPEAIETLRVRKTDLHLEVIAGADHFYSGVRSEVVGRVERWLRTLPP
jgi:pimeloyl-ACP methyl ester carboxylesterase